MERKPIPHADLVDACLAACERARIKPSTFGQKVLKERGFIPRLQAGGRCWPETEARVRQWIKENAPADGAAA